MLLSITDATTGDLWALLAFFLFAAVLIIGAVAFVVGLISIAVEGRKKKDNSG